MSDDGYIRISIEDARHLFDLAVDTPLLCSGSFDTDEVRLLRRFARSIGVDPGRGTPAEFTKEFPHSFTLPTLRLPESDGYPYGRLETQEEARARLGDDPWIPCTVGRGSFGQGCGRLASDPIHQANAPEPVTPDHCGTCGHDPCEIDCPQRVG